MELVIDQNLSEPVYAQITRQIKKQIIENTLKAGEPLPSIRALAKSLRTSVITVKRSYQDLQEEGLITTVVGKGTFVADIDLRELQKEKQSEILKSLKENIKEAYKSGLSLEELQILLEEVYSECDKV